MNYIYIKKWLGFAFDLSGPQNEWNLGRDTENWAISFTHIIAYL